MDTRFQEGIIGFLLFVVGKENQTANFICKRGNSLMCKTVVRSAFFFSSSFFWGGAWHTCHCNICVCLYLCVYVLYIYLYVCLSVCPCICV